jgi:uroporphyrinogen-III synthase
MNDKKIELLSTRPLDKALVNKALKHHIILDCISFIKTENITNNAVSEKIIELASQSITAVFTSMNGAEAVIDILRKTNLQPVWKIYCMGAATQSLLKDYFTLIKIAGTGKNASELSETIIDNSEKKVFFFCGNQRRDELPEKLQERDVGVKEMAVYETKELAVKINKLYHGILFFSPSAVKSFFSMNSIPADTVLFSIGDTTANEIKKNCTNKIIVSDFPAKDKLTEEAIAYFVLTNLPK